MKFCLSAFLCVTGLLLSAIAQDESTKLEVEAVLQMNREVRKEYDVLMVRVNAYNKSKADWERRNNAGLGTQEEYERSLVVANELRQASDAYGKHRDELYRRRDALQKKLLQSLLDQPKDEKAAQELRVVFDDYAKKGEYEKKGGQTFCSDFVRDVAAKRLGTKVPELEGQAKDQFDKLSSASNDLAGSWKKLHFKAAPEEALTNAQKLANHGRVVVVAWKNPQWQNEPHNSGHVAMVVPGDKLTPSPAWSGMKVPNIAQAGGYLFENGKTVTGSAPLSFGFSADKKDEMEIFVYDKPSIPKKSPGME